MHDLRRSSGGKFFDSLVKLGFNFAKLGFFIFIGLIAFLGHILLLKAFFNFNFSTTPYIYLIYSVAVLGFIFFHCIRDLYFKTESSDKILKIVVVLGFLNYFVCWFYGHTNTLATRFAGDPWFELLTCSYTS